MSPRRTRLPFNLTLPGSPAQLYTLLLLLDVMYYLYVVPSFQGACVSAATAIAIALIVPDEFVP